jgi:hypothetical protein
MIMMPTKLACWTDLRCFVSDVGTCILPGFLVASLIFDRDSVPIGMTRGLCIFQKRSSDRSGTHRARDRYFNLDGSSVHVDHAKICSPGWGYYGAEESAETPWPA